MSDQNTQLQKLVSSSGFAFQLAIESTILNTKNQHRWYVHAREYPWSTENGAGYADLIIGYDDGNVHAVVECKRSRDAVWAFLMPDAQQLNRTHARIRWVDTVPNRPILTDWGDIQVYPGSPESEFCAVRGKGEGDQPLLERISTHLLESVERVSLDMGNLNRHSKSTHVVIPLIVTNARIVICKFDPLNIDLSVGDVADGAFTEVPSVRFRKSLSRITWPAEYNPNLTLGGLMSGSERTVFVVNSAALVEWLHDFEFSANSAPWMEARRSASATML